jgi:hypothetical protein
MKIPFHFNNSSIIKKSILIESNQSNFKSNELKKNPIRQEFRELILIY